MTGIGTTPSWGSRLGGIEGLRALAAASIVVGHVWLYAASHQAWFGPFTQLVYRNLGSGLTLFFALSGFLLYRPFVSAVLADEPLPRISSYFRNRALRILPVYWVIVLVASVLLGEVQRSAGSATDSTADTGHLGFALLADNLLLVQDYSPRTLGAGILPAWSLCVEVVFYISLPLLAVAAIRLARGKSRASRLRAAFVPVAVLLLLGFIGKALAWETMAPAREHIELWGPVWHAVLERSFLCSADLFAFGMAAAAVSVLADQRRLPGGARVGRLAAWVALALGCVAGVLYGESALDERVYSTVMGMACGLMILWVVLPGRPLGARRILEARPIVWAGVVSYSVYLWHFPVILWLRDHGLTAEGRTGFLLNLALVGGIVFALSALTWRWVEAPAMRFKAPLRPGPRQAGKGDEATNLRAAP